MKDSITPTHELDRGDGYELTSEERVNRISALQEELEELRRQHREEMNEGFRGRELKALEKSLARMSRPANKVILEDVIINRLCAADRDLTVAVGFFRELEQEEPDNPLIERKEALELAVDTVRNALCDRN